MTRTGLSWDNLDDPPEKNMTCIACPTRFFQPWTTCGDNIGNHLSAKGASIVQQMQHLDLGEDAIMAGRDFADKDFRAVCPSCRTIVDHEELRGQKFKKDLLLLLCADVVCVPAGYSPGTIN